MGEVKDELRGRVRILILSLRELFRRNLGQSELDLLGDERIFPCLRVSTLPIVSEFCI